MMPWSVKKLAYLDQNAFLGVVFLCHLGGSRVIE